MIEAIKYRARFRFKLQKKLHITTNEYRFQVSGREIVLTSEISEIPIFKSEWLVMNVRGFESENEAKMFAIKLKAAAELSSVYCRLGINTGLDLPTSGLFAPFREQLQKEKGIYARDNVHGIDVFPDHVNVAIASVTGTHSKTAGPNPFLSDLDILHPLAESTSKKTKDIVILLNYALFRPDPVSQIVFTISAVEMLDQDQEWNPDQKRLLEQLANIAETADIGTVEERREVSDAFRRSTHKVGSTLLLS